MLAHLKHKLTKLQMHSAVINDFELSSECQTACDKYYILHWQGSHLKHVIRNGTIIHQGVQYLVVYSGCKPFDIKSNSQLYISFRKPAKEYELRAYALVSLGR